MSDKPLKIFVSGPYSAETPEERLKNAMAAIDAGIDLLEKGHRPFIPHLMHWLDERAIQRGIEFSWQDFMDYDLFWLEHCDGILTLGSSKGADIEFADALKRGIKIYYSVEEIGGVTCKLH